MNYENEIWVAVKDYPNYEVSSMGRVRSLQRKAPHILKPAVTNSLGHLKVVLSKDGVRKQLFVHRLVAEAFIPNPENKPTVDHIDRDTSNNCVENLRWADQVEQNKNKKSENWSELCKVPVKCVETGEIFDNSCVAAHWIIDVGLSESKPKDISKYIRGVCKGTLKTIYGYHWEFYYEGADE